MPKTYKISLKLKSGLLTELQSDTIFGHFCWRLRELKGEAELLKILKLYAEQNPIFTISNSFFGIGNSIFLPKPLYEQGLEIKEKSKKEKVIDFIKHKETKKLPYVTTEEFNSILSADYNKFNTLLEKRINLEEKQSFYQTDLRTSVEIDRNTFSNKQGKLFNYAPKHTNENILFVIFIKVVNEQLYKDFGCENILKETFALGFGKKKSSGYGQFEVLAFDIFEGFKEPENPDGFISLSNYLPSKEDGIEDGNYDFQVKYGKLGEQFALSENPFKKPIIFFKPGSTFKTDVRKDFYGRCTRNSEISSIESVVQNGFAFTLNIKF